MRILNGKPGRRLTAARLAVCVLLAAAATGALNTASSACGGATHHVIVDMAYTALDKPAYPGLTQLLQTFPEATDGGSVFPDFGYAPMIFGSDEQYWRDMAEDAHSLAFRKAYLEYVRSIFRQPQSDDDRRTITFLFGLIAHQEADNPWHPHTGPVPGFLPEAMWRDGNTENQVELGSDSFANIEYGEQLFEAAWFFPLGAVQAAYRAIGHEVVQSPMRAGIDAMAALHTLEKGWGYPYYWASLVDLPWTHSNLLTYAEGGMQDGANHTALAWQLAWKDLSSWRSFLPSIRRGSTTSPAGGLQDRANPTANAGQQPGDESRPTGHSGQPVPRVMLLAQQLLKEGAVKTHSRLENGNLFIDRVEIVDQQRVDELTRQMLPELSEPGSR
jgi:hypothetical protein